MEQTASEIANFICLGAQLSHYLSEPLNEMLTELSIRRRCSPTFGQLVDRKIKLVVSKVSQIEHLVANRMDDLRSCCMNIVYILTSPHALFCYLAF